jgi:tetratricopeptide (TPR) repeat protein
MMLLLACIVYFQGTPLHSLWVALATIPVVLMVAIGISLARPTSRASFMGIIATIKGARARNRGDFARSENEFMKSLACAEATTVNHDLSMATALSNLAGAYQTAGRTDDAIPIFKQSLRHYSQLKKPRPTNQAIALAGLGSIYIALGLFEEALPLCREAVEISGKSPRHLRAVMLLNLGQVLVGLGQLQEAESLTWEGLNLAIGAWISRVNLEAAALANLADINRRLGRLPEAEKLGRRALKRAEEAKKADATLRPLTILAETLRLEGKIDEAQSLAERGVEIAERISAGHNSGLERSLATLARIRNQQGRPLEAEQLQKRCLDLLEKLSPEHPENAKRMEEYAATLKALSRPEEAAAWEAKAKTIPVPVMAVDLM